jgi:hypothetical protein
MTFFLLEFVANYLAFYKNKFTKFIVLKKLKNLFERKIIKNIFFINFLMIFILFI